MSNDPPPSDSIPTRDEALRAEWLLMLGKVYDEAHPVYQEGMLELVEGPENADLRLLVRKHQELRERDERLELYANPTPEMIEAVAQHRADRARRLAQERAQPQDDGPSHGHSL